MTAKTASLLILGAACLRFETHAQIHALSYDTPAYLDFEFSEVTVYESQTAAVINVYRSGDVRQTTRVSFATEEGTATEGRDYKGTGGTLTFQPGEGVKQITIPLIADDQAEPDETFTLVLSNASNGTLVMRDQMTITIKDAPGPIATATPKLAISSAGGGKISLSWDGSPGYALERTANAAAGAWEAVSCSPTVTGTHCEVIEPAGGIVYLYRLRGD